MKHNRRDLSPLARARTALERAQQALRDATTDQGSRRAMDDLTLARDEYEAAAEIAANEGTWRRT